MLWKKSTLLLWGICLATSAGAENRISANEFNPAISLILSGSYSQFSNNPDTYYISGFAIADDVNPGREGFSLDESELSISANIDDMFYGYFTAALTAEDSAEVEEAYIETLGLGMGFTIKAGRFFSGIGYLNQQHAHNWDFIDQPLVYKALLDNQLADDGIQLRWLAPTDVYLEFGMEALRGDSFPAANGANDGRGTITLFAHVGGDVDFSNSWQAGLSYIQAKADDRQTGDPVETFNGETKIAAMDFIWKWAPNGNSKETNLKLQAEYFLQNQDGSYNGLSYNEDQNGYYLQAVYQFIPKWRVGLRYDALHADNPGPAFDGTVLDTQGHRPERWSTMVDWSRTEFSRLRLQYNRDDSNPDTDNEVYLQYIMSLGAHGAHRY
jgi:hypothetical protein